MMTVPIAELIRLLEAVEQIPFDHSSLFDQPAFVALREFVQQAFPGAGSKDGLNFALSAAIDRLGISPRRAGVRGRSHSIADAAAKLATGFRETRVRRTHLCPLDMADDFPEISFGPNAVRELSFEALQEIVAPIGPRRAAELDLRFAQFRWLLVREDVDLEFSPGRRAFPALFQNLSSDDFALIEPHARKFPVAVENALFALLLAPWEDLVDHADLNWRAFQIPWVYTVDEDLFIRPASLPSADSLSWAPDFYTDHDGETVEVERPLAYGWRDSIGSVEPWLNDARWRELERALASDLFSTPIAHFLVSAFLGTGIDEFIGHLTALEAALGLRDDRAREKTLGARLQALLADADAAVAYGRLFNLRSDYVHGRPMVDISGADRNVARRLARRVADALVSRAQSPVEDRVGFLQSLAPSRPSRTST